MLSSSGRFFVCQVKVHNPDMGSRVRVAKAGAGLPEIGSPVEMTGSPLVIRGGVE